MKIIFVNFFFQEKKIHIEFKETSVGPFEYVSNKMLTVNISS